MPRTVGVVVEPGRLDVPPGASGRVTVRVVNRSQVVDQFEVAVLGLDERMTPPPQRLGLFPEQEGTVSFDLAVPAQQPPPAGPRVLGIRVVSQDDRRLSRVEEIVLTIGAAPAASLKVHPTRVKGGRSGRFAVLVSNDGNVPVQVALRGEDDAAEVSFEFDPPLVDVPPGSALETYGRMRAPRPFSGPETQRPIVVHGEGGPVPMAAPATFAQRSVIGSRLLQSLVALALVIAGLAIYLGTRPGNAPTSNAVDAPVDSTSPTATASPTPSPTPSSTAGNGQGPVPDVAGSSAADAASQLAKGGFSTEQRTEHSNTVQSGQVIGTDPTPGRTAASADHKVTLIVSDGPTPAVDLRTAAKDADWSNGTVGLTVNGTENDPRGFVLIRDNVNLEDGSTAPRVLETFPQAVTNGFIQGDYTLPNKIIAGDHFVSDLSFLQGAAGDVTFTVFVLDGNGNPVQAGQPVHAVGTDGKNDKLDIDLSTFAGADHLRLRVDAGDNADNDAAVWVNPRITGTPDAPFN